MYELSVDLRSGVRDTDFVDASDTYLGALQREGRIDFADPQRVHGDERF